MPNKQKAIDSINAVIENIEGDHAYNKMVILQKLTQVRGYIEELILSVIVTTSPENTAAIEVIRQAIEGYSSLHAGEEEEYGFSTDPHPHLAESAFECLFERRLP